ncbi:hypothetical protein L6164_010766 [Bauhinia variegata]|uniref:Uncharacterized protein n=1 Tax=Bauhinia variegata TaxID=167791 RepID=A0ACB9P4S9_BAUVA|nr:hypothetical protein L6164_010766 [Bauhinia variegata]
MPCAFAVQWGALDCPSMAQSPHVWRYQILIDLVHSAAEKNGSDHLLVKSNHIWTVLSHHAPLVVSSLGPGFQLQIDMVVSIRE